MARKKRAIMHSRALQDILFKGRDPNFKGGKLIV